MIRSACSGRCDHGVQPPASPEKAPAIKADRNSTPATKLKEPMKPLLRPRSCRAQLHHRVKPLSPGPRRTDSLPNRFPESDWDDSLDLKPGPSLQEPVIR